MDNLARLLKESWTLVEDDRDRLSGHFYARLFLLDPALRQLFPVQMTGQGDRLLEAIVTAIQTVDDPESFDEYLRALGRDHRKYHVDEPSTTRRWAPRCWTRCAASPATAGTSSTTRRGGTRTRRSPPRCWPARRPTTNPPFWHAEVLTHERYGPDIAVLTCRALQHPLRWRAGQYVSLEVPRYHPRLWRTYSVANAPNDDNVLEFHVRSPGAGWVSGALVRRVRPGDLLRLAAPMGSMTLDRASDTGHPLRGRRRRAGADQGAGGGVGQLQPDPVGARLLRRPAGRRDLYGLAALQELVAVHPWLSVTPACSDDPDFDGEQGDIPDVVARYGPWTTHDFYVSGVGPDGPVHPAGARRGRRAAAAHPLRHLR